MVWVVVVCKDRRAGSDSAGCRAVDLQRSAIKADAEVYPSLHSDTKRSEGLGFLPSSAGITLHTNALQELFRVELLSNK